MKTKWDQIWFLCQKNSQIEFNTLEVCILIVSYAVKKLLRKFTQALSQTKTGIRFRIKDSENAFYSMRLLLWAHFLFTRERLTIIYIDTKNGQESDNGEISRRRIEYCRPLSSRNIASQSFTLIHCSSDSSFWYFFWIKLFEFIVINKPCLVLPSTFTYTIKNKIPTFILIVAKTNFSG